MATHDKYYVTLSAIQLGQSKDLRCLLKEAIFFLHNFKPSYSKFSCSSYSSVSPCNPALPTLLVLESVLQSENVTTSPVVHGCVKVQSKQT